MRKLRVNNGKSAVIAAITVLVLAGCASGEAANDGEIVTITAKLLNNTVSAEGAARVIERLNELTEAKIGVHVDAEFIEFGSWNQTINLMISGSEAVDVISLSPMLTIDMLEKQNALMDITDLLEEYGRDILEEDI